MKISSWIKIFYFWRGLVCISMVLTGLESRKRVASAPACVLIFFSKKTGVVVLPSEAVTLCIEVMLLKRGWH